MTQDDQDPKHETTNPVDGSEVLQQLVYSYGKYINFYRKHMLFLIEIHTRQVCFKVRFLNHQFYIMTQTWLNFFQTTRNNHAFHASALHEQRSVSEVMVAPHMAHRILLAYMI